MTIFYAHSDLTDGGTECRHGLMPCSLTALATESRVGGVYQCVDASLWCDGHVNCGLLENVDELTCSQHGKGQFKN